MLTQNSTVDELFGIEKTRQIGKLQSNKPLTRDTID
jgi:hypothetical protein